MSYTLEQALDVINDLEDDIEHAYDEGYKDGEAAAFDSLPATMVEITCTRCDKVFRTSNLLNIMYCSKDCENGNYKRPK